VERNIERWAESIAAMAERIASRVERHAESLADRIEREFDGSPRRRRDRIRDEDWTGRDLAQQAQRIDTTFSFSTGGIADLSSISGDIVINGWERREARVQARTDRGQLEYEFTSSRLTLEHRREGSRRERGTSEGTRYDVWVPRGTRVMLRSTSGDLEIRSVGGEVEANTTSGDIRVVDASGRVEAGTVSGDVMLERVRGEAQATSVSGQVEARDIEGDLHLGSTSGDIVVDGARGRDVELSTTSGDVSYTGVIEGSGRYEFHSHSGTIDLAIPAASSARFSVETFSGAIDSDFPITLQPGNRAAGRPTRFDFTVGSGGPRVIAESFSGDVTIRKR
jgi:DUF4097 and DUF4098 domain-containing protein YvlB